jgi:benzoyl-CoA 2,3-dioxygenase component B
VYDVQQAIDRWNKIPEKAGIPLRFTLPHKGFHRKIGFFADQHVSPDGKVLSEAEWTHKHGHWLPSDEDRAYVHSLMGRVAEPGKFANWIAAPGRGINNQPIDFEYVRFN